MSDGMVNKWMVSLEDDNEVKTVVNKSGGRIL